MGLNDDYNSIRGNILMMSHLPSIGQVYFMLIQEEKQREIRSSGHFITDSASLAVQSHMSYQYYKENLDRLNTRTQSLNSKFNRNEEKKSALFCNYCKKPGHSIEKGYKLHGFPPNSKYKGPRRTAALAQTDGSMINDCHTALPLTNVAVPGLTSEQSSQLIALLQNVQLHKAGHNYAAPSQDCSHNFGSGAFSSLAGTNIKGYTQSLCLLSCVSGWQNTWIIDTRPSDCMCCNKDLFENFVALAKPNSVTLSNGKCVLVTHAGTVAFKNHLTLHGVLYIPSFRYNPLSVSKLAS